MTRDEAKQKSGFKMNPVGATGFFCGDTNPLSQDCYWRCIIRAEKDDKFLVEIESGEKNWILKKEFTPLYIRWNK